jgi:tetratricopeptide (TPR) repeat protein
MHGNHPRWKRILASALALSVLLAPALAHGWQLQPVQPLKESEDAPPVVREAPDEDAPPAGVTEAAGKTPLDVQTASFQGLVPGKATVADIKAKLGDPVSSAGDVQQAELVYRVPPFPEVEFLITDGVATSIVIHLSRPSEPEKIATELGFGPFRPTPVTDEQGRVLGRAYPERGVLFVLSEQGQPKGVSHIMLEPVSAEPFILRATSDKDHRYQDDLADLDYAQQLTPGDARIYAVRAKILGSIGRVDEALENMSTAVKLEGENIQHRLFGARLLVKAGENDRALLLAQAIAEHEGVDELTRARAEMLWGDILATGANGEYQEATTHHTKAVKLAAPLAAGEDTQTRRAARQVVLDAYLAVARNIALGNWRNKEATVSRWLSQASQIADDAVNRDGADPVLRLAVQRGTLAALAGMNGKGDPSAAVSGATKLIREKLAAGADPLYRNELEWELGQALFDASRVQQSRGKTDEAIQLAKQSLELLEKAAADRDASEMQHYLLGRVCFRLGSYYAVGKSDHQQAITWYQKSLLHFAEPLPVSAEGELGLHGERYVSMGASYWKVGQQEAGVKLTEQGVKWIKRAVEGGRTPEQTLGIPYGNLAAMHKKLGHKEQAEEIANLASRIEADAPMRR